MQAIVLLLKGALRSWGGLSLGDNRDTLSYPTASAATGLLGAMAGIDRNDVEALNTWFQSWQCMTLTASSQGKGVPEMLWDFQTARGSLDTSGNERKFPVVSSRAYLQDTLDVIALVLEPHASQDLLFRALQGARNPVYTPCLGRICNPFGAPPWPPKKDILVEGSAQHLAETMVEWIQEERGSKPLKALLTAPAGWLRDWPGGSRAYRKGIQDRRLGPELSYGIRMVDLFMVERSGKGREGGSDAA